MSFVDRRSDAIFLGALEIFQDEKSERRGQGSVPVLIEFRANVANRPAGPAGYVAQRLPVFRLEADRCPPRADHDAARSQMIHIAAPSHANTRNSKSGVPAWFASSGSMSGHFLKVIVMGTREPISLSITSPQTLPPWRLQNLTSSG